jgi:sugar O-acyltransferase (sialic acid O-acetyltransferase NeuD family)
MKRMIFWGATGQAKVLRECMGESGLELVAVFDRQPGLSSPFADVPIHVGRTGFESWLADQASPEEIGFMVAIGGDRGRDRVEIQAYLASFRLTPLIATHRTAFVAASASIGAGSQVLAHASVCVDVVIGDACVINTAAVVDHECQLADGVHIAPGARLAGCVEVGRYATIGVGATVLPRLAIGEGAVVGAGAVVTHDVPASTTVVGNPAGVLKASHG